MPLAAGTRLGPYEVLDLVGFGGMGEVYRARDPRLGRDVAIKVLPAEVGADPDRLRRFEQEARAVAALNHPNILTVFDVGAHVAAGETAVGAVAPAIPYVVMELLQGETLRELASRRAPTQRQVLGWAVQAAQGLEAAHAKGIVHRDLKPENVFVTTEGRVKVLDFGLAKQADRADGGERRGHRVVAHGRGAGGGHRRLHVAGAGAGPRGGPADGRLLVRGAAVRAAGRAAPVPAGDDDRDVDGDPGGEAGGAFDAGAGNPAGGVGDRAAVPGEGAGGAIRLGARREGGARGGAGGASGIGGAAGGGGEEPLPRPHELHREGLALLLRARAGGEGALGEAAGSAPVGRDRTLGGGEDVLRARGGRGVAAGGLGGDRLRTGSRALPGAGPGARARAGRGHRGDAAPAVGGRSRRRLRPREPVARGARRGAPGRGPVRGALHAERAGGAGALRGAARASRARGRRPRAALVPRRLPDEVRGPRAAREGVRVAHAAAGAERGGPRAGARGAGEGAGVPVRGRRSRRGDGGVGGGGAVGAAAAGVCGVASLGEAGPGEEGPDAGGLRGDRGCGGRPRAARGGDARSASALLASRSCARSSGRS